MPSIISYPDSASLPLGQSTVTSYPASRKETGSFCTRVSCGTGWFSTMMRIFFFTWRSLFYLQLLVESSQGAEHRRLPPVECRGLVDQPRRISTVIEIASAVLHVGDRPLRHLDRQLQALGIAIGKEDQSVDGRRTALNGKRKSLVVVVSWGSIRKKESFLPVLVSIHQLLVEAVLPRALRVMLEAIKNVCRVEAVHPVMIHLFGVVPR